MEIIYAKDLRDRDNKKKIPFEPGYYRWWAKENEVKLLLKDYFSELFSYLRPGESEDNNLEGYYLIYVGIASKLRNRINIHVNQKHSKGNLDNDGLSTLRNTISVLLTGTQKGEKETNELMDKLKIQYFNIDTPKDYENEDLNNPDFVVPLNIDKNEKSVIQDFKTYLEQERKKAKEQAKNK